MLCYKQGITCCEYDIYDGKQIINPDSLEELDTREIEVPYGGEKGTKQPVQKTRDVIKSVIAMMDKRIAYLLLAIEVQANIHYAMPVKNMVYDALQYAKQIEDAIFSHKKSGDYKGADSDEYLSGFMKNDHLLPVVTLVIYFDSKEWDGPLSLHEMFGEQDRRVLALVPDYKINLLAPASIRDHDFKKFQSSLKEVLSFIMAIQQMNEEAAKNERISTLLNSIKNLMGKMGWSAEQTMDILNVSENDRKILSRLLK